MKQDKARLLILLRAAGEERRQGRALIHGANGRAALLAPQARDAGATVREIAEAYGITRSALYALMEGRTPEVGS